MNFVEKFLEWRKESNGFITKEGKLWDHSEWHGLVIGGGAALAGGPPELAGLYALVTGAKGLSGHLKDVKKEFGYTVGGFTAIEYVPEAVQVIISWL